MQLLQSQGKQVNFASLIQTLFVYSVGEEGLDDIIIDAPPMQPMQPQGMQGGTQGGMQPQLQGSGQQGSIPPQIQQALQGLQKGGTGNVQ